MPAPQPSPKHGLLAVLLLAAASAATPGCQAFQSSIPATRHASALTPASSTSASVKSSMSVPPHMRRGRGASSMRMAGDGQAEGAGAEARRQAVMAAIARQHARGADSSKNQAPERRQGGDEEISRDQGGSMFKAMMDKANGIAQAPPPPSRQQQRQQSPPPSGGDYGEEGGGSGRFANLMAAADGAAPDPYSPDFTYQPQQPAINPPPGGKGVALDEEGKLPRNAAMDEEKARIQREVVQRQQAMMYKAQGFDLSAVEGLDGPAKEKARMKMRLQMEATSGYVPSSSAADDYMAQITQEASARKVAYMEKMKEVGNPWEHANPRNGWMATGGEEPQLSAEERNPIKPLPVIKPPPRSSAPVAPPKPTYRERLAMAKAAKSGGQQQSSPAAVAPVAPAPVAPPAAPEVPAASVAVAAAKEKEEQLKQQLLLLQQQQQQEEEKQKQQLLLLQQQQQQEQQRQQQLLMQQQQQEEQRQQQQLLLQQQQQAQQQAQQQQVQQQQAQQQQAQQQQLVVPPPLQDPLASSMVSGDIEEVATRATSLMSQHMKTPLQGQDAADLTSSLQTVRELLRVEAGLEQPPQQQTPPAPVAAAPSAVATPAAVSPTGQAPPSQPLPTPAELKAASEELMPGGDGEAHGQAASFLLMRKANALLMTHVGSEAEGGLKGENLELLRRSLAMALSAIDAALEKEKGGAGGGQTASVTASGAEGSSKGGLTGEMEAAEQALIEEYGGVQSLGKVLQNTPLYNQQAQGEGAGDEGDAPLRLFESGSERHPEFKSCLQTALGYLVKHRGGAGFGSGRLRPAEVIKMTEALAKAQAMLGEEVAAAEGGHVGGGG